MLRTMGTAHKVARMGGYHLTALRMFYLATRGAAEALGWEDRIGSFVPGAEADFIVLDPAATPLPVSYTHLTLPTKEDECRSRWSPYH